MSTIKNGNVILVEPNDININTTQINGHEFVNGIPQYQDMYIFAELIAHGKGRTVIMSGGQGNTVDTEKSKPINLLGNNQDNTNENPNYLNFTTNYYDGSTGSRTQYEGFGISNIKITVNSSYVPQVSIQFVDLRGIAFFNQKNSPYRVLFEFPPPSFELTVKGYYGKALTYILHLVKYTTEFNAENGNFIIDADFVAMTFAPLSDILFRYIVNFNLSPVIDNQESSDPNTTKEPVNTNDLITKLKNLYSGISNKIKSEQETINYDNTNKAIENVALAIRTLGQFNENAELTKENTPYLVIKDVISKNYIANTQPELTTSGSEIPSYVKTTIPPTQTNIDAKITPISGLSSFDEEIKKESSSGLPQNLSKRLSIVFIAGTNITPPNEQDWLEFNADAYIGDAGRIQNLKTILNTYRATLIKNTNPSLGTKLSDISEARPFFGDVCLFPASNTPTQYVELDVTDYYYKLYRKRVDLVKKKNELANDITLKVNNMVNKNLGMTPSIYNIFKIILKDVDEFFKTLRKTSENAYNEHNKKDQISIISGNPSNDVKNKKEIFSFPLIIETNPVYGGVKEERVAPTKLQSMGANFPELDLIQKFIDTFKYQSDREHQNDLRNEQNDDGSNKWIPISPFDSTLGGASPQSPYFGLNGDIKTQTYQTLLKRFYILSQGTIKDDFYNTTKRTAANDAYVKLFAESEAVNVASTLTNEDNSNTIKQDAMRYKGKADLFYEERLKNLQADNYEGNSINLYNFSSDVVEYFPITPQNTEDNKVYINKNNPNYIGVYLYPRDISTQEISETNESSKPINKFAKNAKNEWWKIFNSNPKESFAFDFTQENVIFIRDINTSTNGVSTLTRFLWNDPDNRRTRKNSKFPDSLIIAYEQGNISFGKTTVGNKTKLGFGESIVAVWVNELGYGNNDKIIYEKIINYSGNSYDSNLSALMVLSSFGNALSPFNIYPSDLNHNIFSTPAAIEVPEYLSPYIGALVSAIEKGWVEDILYFYTGNTALGSGFQNQGYYILADLHDVENYLSDNDKQTFKLAYDNFINYAFQDIQVRLFDLYNEVNSNTGTNGRFATKSIGYDILLNPSNNSDDTGKGSYFDILTTLITRKNIINYSQITFKMEDMSTLPNTYDSLLTINLMDAKKKINVKKNINDTFFNTFFAKLDSEIIAKNKKQKEEAEEQKKIKGDNDIITQTYYSLKNINDKWLTAPIEKNVFGYPFNKPGKNLIDSFAFIDRAMNPIGDTIINTEILTNILDDPNISVFSVLTQLLSANGFEFFPLQNFMNYELEGGSFEKSWENSFKIYSGNIETTPSSSFVCMYIGGASNYPSVPTNNFENDGIIDLSNPDVQDFSTKKPQDFNTVNDEQTNGNKDFPWRQVRAFRVRFGEQNQSMFNNIKIDSKEYTDTNESIQILSRLAGDNKINAPTPKGQNLYNLYENRSYRATITGLGNAMIQPTQYFQLENIPMFDGAYIILSVEHNISANKMTTTFSGTKVLKYPIPRVTNPIAFTTFGNELGSTTSGQFTQLALTTEYDQVKYNAMYTLKLG
jgi:hypothetical protein